MFEFGSGHHRLAKLNYIWTIILKRATNNLRDNKDPLEHTCYTFHIPHEPQNTPRRKEEYNIKPEKQILISNSEIQPTCYVVFNEKEKVTNIIHT